jgi:hypothetical protein
MSRKTEVLQNWPPADRSFQSLLESERALGIILIQRLTLQIERVFYLTKVTQSEGQRSLHIG